MDGYLRLDLYFIVLCPVVYRVHLLQL